MERESTQREQAVWNSRIQSNWPSERFCERNLYKIPNSWTLLFIWISTLYIDASHYVTLKRSNLGKLLNGMKSLFQLYNHVFIKALTSQVYRKIATLRYIILKWSIPTCHMIQSTKPFPKWPVIICDYIERRGKCKWLWTPISQAALQRQDTAGGIGTSRERKQQRTRQKREKERINNILQQPSGPLLKFNKTAWFQGRLLFLP